MTTPIANWVLISGDFVRTGGQDRANYELARYIIDRLSEPVALVAHAVDDALATHPLVSFVQVRRPWGKHVLGGPLLARVGRQVAHTAWKANPAVRVVVNGGNCRWLDVNWVHMVHAAYPLSDRRAPLTFRVKHRITHLLSCRMERRCLHPAKLIVANSERTKIDLIERVGVSAKRIRVVYLGTDPGVFHMPTAAEREVARRHWQVGESELVIAFIGALGYDPNKGLDILLAAVRHIGARVRPWLVLAAGGGRLSYWQARATAEGVHDRIRFLGHTSSVPELLAAADLLVSPTRYDAYGLGVHEALCRGVPAIVSASTGVAERFPDDLRDLLLPNPDDAADLALRIDRVTGDLSGWKEKVRKFGARLRCKSWADMAAEMIGVIRSCPRAT